ncbi:hypothetical protein PL263_07550 [Methylomonas sp. EFPC3]|uniref:hypothetical protein n=1 Tax=Methylomonas sp. EFPC3 TaxID=3021710 RepID=UPI0024170220|nr:hypothetical protein [Methylomonas sp. EFPC3]WFP51877.1 hypothetical protein PL263_07550 [Methylomonas sp. EFPC3]
MTPTNINRFLHDQGLKTICEPRFLTPLPDAEEEALLARRTQFVKFHREMFRLSDQEIKKLARGYSCTRDRERWRAYQPEQSIQFDLRLLEYAIEFQSEMRNNSPVNIEFLQMCASWFRKYADLAEDEPHITSDYLLEMVKEWLLCTEE